MYPTHEYNNDLEAQQGGQYRYPNAGNEHESDPLINNNKFPSESLANFNPRLGFVRKVYGIICCQLLITSIFCYLGTTSEAYSSFLFSSTGLSFMITAAVLSVILMLTITCCTKVARSVPINYVILGIFTLCESYLVSYCCVMTDPKLVVMAALMTLGVTIALTIYAVTTTTDITYMGGALFIVSCALLFFGIFAIFTTNNTVHILYCVFGILFYGFYLIYDTQLIMGNGEYGLTIDDYVIGAVIVYLDIIILFVRILQLLKRS